MRSVASAGLNGSALFRGTAPAIGGLDADIASLFDLGFERVSRNGDPLADPIEILGLHCPGHTSANSHDHGGPPPDS